MKEKKIIFILTSLTLIFLISLVFYIYQNDKSEKLRIKQENELQDVYLELDSISNLLNDKILTISQLGGEIDSLSVKNHYKSLKSLKINPKSLTITQSLNHSKIISNH